MLEEGKTFVTFAQIHFSTQGGGQLNLAEIEEKFRAILAEEPSRWEVEWLRAEDATAGGLRMSFALTDAAILYFGCRSGSERDISIQEISCLMDWVGSITKKFSEAEFKFGLPVFVSGGVQLNSSTGAYATKAFSATI
ncbi:MAG TPA: hypothetical protein VHD55_02495 [Candidatus Paceibacterota bacterium]|nr:hypothetical protein [Candidatus Paceibacterota bacterium]